ncbi:MAG: carbamoyl-phosphate synthase (glutamine-hydrolyzing) large subunit [Candidatus Coatesbacteria bacterium]|nr:carbamoyl-phosphate synthase (glutamine-hydrolyzing) large subunit [Candidatus Coatesbacteria bacterium]
MKQKYRKVLIIGSGAIKIGQAGEFDYSGSQAIKALKEEGISTILINPNIATIQTSEHLADKVYFLPVNSYFIEKIIEKERPDGILLGFGGQTALNTGIELARKGVLEEYGTEILGSPLEAILNTEDRELFKHKIKELDLRIPSSMTAHSETEVISSANSIGYPVMVRAAYALGGLGSGIAYNEAELRELSRKSFAFSEQVLIEEYLDGWKELEYEVVRDVYDNCIVVCSMENIDPMGIHTGESIVVAPVQTLTSAENFMLRAISIKVIRYLGIIGECNIQFALNPENGDYRIIEVNARLSRSSALASKATGYPLAFIATKLSLGYSLSSLKNSITKETSAFFEPALDYIIVKFPRWDLQKFNMINQEIGSEMKSVGEVMAIGRKFEEALQKAIRMLDIGANGLTDNDFTFENPRQEIRQASDKRIFAIAEGLKKGISIDEMNNLSKINKWFLYKLKNIIDIEEEIRKYSLENLPHELLLDAKRLGFADLTVAKLVGSDEISVRVARKSKNIVPVVKNIDTLAAEYPAQTNYLYTTYNGDENDISFSEKNQVMILGGGPYRIGSSVEFDWCCVTSAMRLRKNDYKVIMLNCNPETVSTDYDICNKLYFEEITFEKVLDIYELESPTGIIVSMGGQTPNSLALPLYNHGVHILGTSPEDIDRAEDRHKFSNLLDELKIDQPEWKELTSIEEAEMFAQTVGFPVLVRPSYVLSGAAMSIILSRDELKFYLEKASSVSKKHPAVISKFITEAKEIEIDAVAKKGKLVCYAISEHIENAGVHSGDATLVLPPQRTYLETMRRIKTITKNIASELHINGPFNIQFIAKENDVKVIECNLRTSRSFPFVSKIFRLNFIELATDVIMQHEVPVIDRSAFDLDYVGVKSSEFSFTRLKGSDPILGVEMRSTGEVACIGDDFNEAFMKSLISTGFKLPVETILLSTGPIDKKAEFLEYSFILHKRGMRFYATSGTADFMRKYGIETEILNWPLDMKEPNILTYLSDGKIDLVINIPKNIEREELDNDYLIRRKSVDLGIPLITNMQLAKRFVEAISRLDIQDLKIKSWDEYK